MNIYQFYAVAGRRFRRRRMRLFLDLLGKASRGRVLDVGGTPANWSLVESTPNPVLLNLQFPKREWRRGFTWVVADAAALPFSSGAFDIVFSNSVIEHLGSKANQQAFAGEVVRVGTSYFIQTPNFYFPIELHFLTPGFQFLPKGVQMAFVKALTVRGWLGASRDELTSLASSLRLLSIHELQRMFPDGKILRERFAGLTKSLIAVRVASRMGT